MCSRRRGGCCVAAVPWLCLPCICEYLSCLPSKRGITEVSPSFDTTRFESCLSSEQKVVEPWEVSFLHIQPFLLLSSGMFFWQVGPLDITFLLSCHPHYVAFNTGKVVGPERLFKKRLPSIPQPSNLNL